MRPRVFPAEDLWPRCGTWSGFSRFNEAAGIPRGRQRQSAVGLAVTSCFNEAAGIPRGRLAVKTTLLARKLVLQ